MRVLGLLVLLCGCAPRAAVSNAPPAFVLGTFADDYGSTYQITDQTWDHIGYARYHIVRWRPEAGYLVARNDDANPTDGGLWTRIDWVPLEMAPYVWAFCLSAYDAPTAAAAEATRTAQPETPRTGCGGHPFSRMQQAEPSGS